MQNVSRNGTMLLNLTQHGRGDLDPEVIAMAKDVGAWLKINGKAVFGSRPFEVYGENNICFTRNNGYIYATIFNWDDSPITFKSLHSNGSTLGKISRVDMLGSDIEINFVQNETGLTITPSQKLQSIDGITDSSLSHAYRVLQITHDKGWVNDDDPGIVAPGWKRACNLESGDYNNDLTMSEIAGDVWSYSFKGSGVTVIAPKEEGAGIIEIQIDDNVRATVNLSTTGIRKPQQLVCEIRDLEPGNHTIKIINRGDGNVAIDALKIDNLKDEI